MKRLLILAYDFPPYVSVGGLRPYAWYKYLKEFGVNLLDSAARHNRKITEDEAYALSDKMIRSDYFKKHEAESPATLAESID